MSLSIRILGCGSSGGVPRLGGENGAGNWGACDPANSKNRRSRCSILVRQGSAKLLVDTSPDMREQLLAARISDLDGVLITHDHADQLHGLDDLRPLTLLNRRRVNLWSDARGLGGIRAKFGYCLETPPGSDYPPIVNAHEIPEPFREFEIAGIRVLAFGQGHGNIRSLGFRFGPVAYSPDVDALGDDAFAALEGVECWIVDALRYTPHPSHAHLERTLAWIARVRPRRAILTNLHVDLDYARLKGELPAGVEPAYDGMELEF
ncbi:MAG: MBL fold metallo-hydrolase [Alphaproteobacteria bacterium]|nr:MBL fold metallo-hydrolase [Alphaproteobacteria bacterium]